MTLSEATKRIEAAGWAYSHKPFKPSHEFVWQMTLYHPTDPDSDECIVVEVYRYTRRECLSAAAKIAEALEGGG